MYPLFGMEGLLTLKPYIHILIALGLWIFAVVLLAAEQTNWTAASIVMLHVDQVHTYALNKIPVLYDGVGGARSTILTNFNTQWTIPADDVGCFALVNWTGNAACTAKRNLLVTSTRTAMGCDVYRSAGCNCANQVLKAIANDTNPSAALPNTFTGVFSTIGRNVTGQQANILAALDSCHFMHHPPYVAVQTNGNTLARRACLLFILTTMVTGNAVIHFLFAGPSSRSGFSWLPRLAGLLVWPVVALVVPVALEGGATNLVLLILLPPLAIMGWYEMMFHSAHKSQFIHPYYFAAILATLNVMALIENSVVDYENIMFEIWKAHMISLLYFGTLWFSGKSSMYTSDKHRGLFLSRQQQDGILICALLSFLSAVCTGMAPYTSVAYTSYMLWMPLVFVLVSFFGILWLTEVDRFRERFASSAGAPGKRTPGAHESGKGVPIASLVMSSGVLIITAFVVIFYWRDFSVVWHATQENMPTRSVQYNTSYAWINPVF